MFDRDVSSRPPFVLAARGERTQLSATLASYHRPSPSPAGGGPELVALARDDGKVVVTGRDGGAVRVIGSGSHPFFDASGARVLFRDAADHAHLMAGRRRAAGR